MTKSSSPGARLPPFGVRLISHLLLGRSSGFCFPFKYSPHQFPHLFRVSQWPPWAGSWNDLPPKGRPWGSELCVSPASCKECLHLLHSVLGGAAELRMALGPPRVGTPITAPGGSTANSGH